MTLWTADAYIRDATDADAPPFYEQLDTFDSTTYGTTLARAVCSTTRHIVVTRPYDVLEWVASSDLSYAFALVRDSHGTTVATVDIYLRAQ